ncbi:hypothetical protein BU26DRAFT_320164 [Trematosphaeria pertusa]|uniref:Uncharacterized protein n=1 Tax=Trematosphaeria pertusa TaxID=390896 RepID=A0A6A6IHC0_9PLEO|nr:uncharacterized protein BU26DRAFT_320164 [Trematosphaeria pertusa]KAF2249567.1 hypothetical protein BU26DRAFT_320164 [Trematosphaeria pertusa]
MAWCGKAGHAYTARSYGCGVHELLLFVLAWRWQDGIAADFISSLLWLAVMGGWVGAELSWWDWSALG